MINIIIIYASLSYNEFNVTQKDIEKQQKALEIEQEKLYNLIK